jgi:hypothetical protein
MIPDGANVYGHVIAPQGLRVVSAALKTIAEWEVSAIQKKELVFDSARVMLRSEFSEGDEHMICVRVNGCDADVIFFTIDMSRALQAAGLEHHFEVYDARDRYIADVSGAKVVSR